MPYSRSVRFMGRTVTGTTDKERTPPPGESRWSPSSELASSLGGDLLTGDDQVGVADELLVLLVQRLPAAGHLLLGGDLGQRVTRDDGVVALRVGLHQRGGHGGRLHRRLLLLGLLDRRALLLRLLLRLGLLLRRRTAAGTRTGAAHRPRADALRLQDVVRDPDLLRARRVRWVAGTAVGLPGALA